MRRLYSTFAGGWPGIGLLLMRFVLGGTLVLGAIHALPSEPMNHAIASGLLASCGLLLIAGLWTPVVGSCIVFVQLWRSVSRVGNPEVAVLLATIACALALLGPGLWSVDARLFGWKRVEVPPRKSS